MSAKDPIEELFRDNQHGLDEQPPGLVWDKIEERLDEKSVQKKKLNVWKYAVAASVVFAVGIGLFALLNNQNQVINLPTQEEITYEEPVEINHENASEILDKIEEKNQSVVVNEKKTSAPEMMENKPKQEATPKLKVPEYRKPEPVYDVAPAAEMSIAPTEKEMEMNQLSEETAFSKKENLRKIENFEKSTSYDTIYYKKTIKQLPIKLSEKTIYYDLIENTMDSIVFYNSNIAFPQRIILTKKEENIHVEFKGNPQDKNTKESKEIQLYINQNKKAIYQAGIEAGIQID